MENKVFNFDINIDWNLINLISEIDRFDSGWIAIERREGQSLKQLKTIATIRSIGASNRIEGNKMTDEEIDIFLKNIDISRLTDRDKQEVAGYFDTLYMISESYQNIDISENNIKNLHNILMKYSTKDNWHKGNYKQHNNAVEATFPNGMRQIIFQTTEAGFATDDAVRQLIAWYNAENEIHSLIKTAVFVYDFLSIHPFQDGNGRLSRLLSTLLLLKTGYKWIQYVSFEHEIESRKNEYYQALRGCQAQRPNENISAWVLFFLNALKNIREQLMRKLQQNGLEMQLSPREKSILTLIQNHSGIKSGEIAEKLAIPNPTVKRILSDLHNKNLIEKFGNGRNTCYLAK
ncbi:MAG: Fic family protein [Prevotellaceae bacterium]|jgi:Fic family protein|nr:Fic family protein [Prevotellaceae bacterium]